MTRRSYQYVSLSLWSQVDHEAGESLRVLFEATVH